MESLKRKMHFVECEICEFAVGFDYPNETFFFCKEHKFGVNVSNADLGRAHICKACGKQMERYDLDIEDNVCPICYGMLAMCYNFAKASNESQNNMNDDKLLHDAFLIALEAHQGQRRKTEDAPYIVHPVMVAQKLAEYGFAKEVVAAGLVHDVLEDTEFAEAELENRLGIKVVETVKTVSHLGHRSWEESRKEYLNQVAQGSPAAKAVCCADKINNVQSIIAAHATMGEAAWQRFSRGREKQLWFYRAVLEMLKSTWDSPMIAEYEKLVAEMENLPA